MAVTDAQGGERFPIGEIGDLEGHIVQSLSELLRQAVPYCLGNDLEIFGRACPASAHMQPPIAQGATPELPPSHDLLQFRNRLPGFDTYRLQ